MLHVPDTGPGKRVTGAGARTDGREASRQSSEVGAVCRKAARTVLCGGRPVMGVPTAIARVGNGFRAHSATSGHVPTSGPMVRIRLAPARSQQSGRSSPACFRAGRELTQGQRIEISAIALAYLRPLFQASCSPERIRRSLIWERLFESGGTAR